MPMGRSEQSERPYFYPRRAHLYTTRKRAVILPAEVVALLRRGRVKFTPLICRTAERQPFHDCNALTVSMLNEYGSFSRLCIQNVHRTFWTAMDGQHCCRPFSFWKKKQKHGVTFCYPIKRQHYPNCKGWLKQTPTLEK